MSVAVAISVVVPIYNGAHVLPFTVPAMMAQEVAAEWLFVDDGSTDDTAEVLRGLLDAHSPHAPTARVQILTHPVNRGRAAARNTGIAAATGAILLLLDADVAPAPDLVRWHIVSHQEEGVVGVVSRGEPASFDTSDPFGRYLASPRRGPSAWGASRPLPFRYFITPYTSVKADAARAVGPMDEGIRYGEDLDFAVRLGRLYPDGLRYEPRARAVQHDTGTLEKALATWRQFGREGIPRLLHRHPELTSTLGGEWVHSAGPTLRGVLGAMLLRDRPAHLIQRLLPALPRPLDEIAVRYLFGAALNEGVRAARRLSSTV